MILNATQQVECFIVENTSFQILFLLSK